MTERMSDAEFDSKFPERCILNRDIRWKGCRAEAKRAREAENRWQKNAENALVALGKLTKIYKKLEAENAELKKWVEEVDKIKQDNPELFEEMVVSMKLRGKL